LEGSRRVARQAAAKGSALEWQRRPERRRGESHAPSGSPGENASPTPRPVARPPLAGGLEGASRGSRSAGVDSARMHRLRNEPLACVRLLTHIRPLGARTPSCSRAGRRWRGGGGGGGGGVGAGGRRRGRRTCASPRSGDIWRTADGQERSLPDIEPRSRATGALTLDRGLRPFPRLESPPPSALTWVTPPSDDDQIRRGPGSRVPRWDFLISRGGYALYPDEGPRPDPDLDIRRFGPRS
jgi:hypothetical protein